MIIVNSLLLGMLSKLITDYESTLDKTIDMDLNLGFPVCINGGAECLWFNPQDTKNILVINQSLGDSSFLADNDELKDIANGEQLSLVICNISRVVTLVLTQKDSEDIVIAITDVEEKEYNLVSMEDLFFCLAQEIADNLDL
jgi:hypothetical protein